MILEYKMDRSPDGKLITPSWIECGGFFRDPDNFSMIGFSQAVREYKIPDSALRLNLAELKDRVVDIHSRYPIINYMIGGGVMTTQEVEDLVSATVTANDIT